MSIEAHPQFTATRYRKSRTSLVSCKKSLEERSILPQDEPKGSEVVEAGD